MKIYPEGASEDDEPDVISTGRMMQLQLDVGSRNGIDAYDLRVERVGLVTLMRLNGLSIDGDQSHLLGADPVRDRVRPILGKLFVSGLVWASKPSFRTQEDPALQKDRLIMLGTLNGYKKF